ncbi:ABC transporter permease [Leptolinea tardivitalis]|uniref:ABC transporter permease n=1 Tax=Leptolinea tardivitalis TaxID=229920 RepID=UPI0009D6F7FD|nr:ABC transporter permease [Leptolinea tardivitalis]GAP21164.1 nucleoside ABC transporter membrane protein [Leptolinea tardivitalis]
MDKENLKPQEPTPPEPINDSKFINIYLVPILAVVTALILGAFIIWWVGGNPLLAYKGLLQGAFGSVRALSETTVWASPYIFAGLAVAVGFKGGLFNIGGEGQLAFGAVAASWAGYALPGIFHAQIPPILHILLSVGIGMLAGAIWGGIPGYLKAKTGAHEVINTIMMNYIALNLTSFLLNGPMKDPSPSNVIARTPLIAESARIPAIFPNYRFHWGFILALALAFGVWWLLWKTRLGFEIRTTGLNPDAAKYAGIDVAKTIVIAMSLSGALAGLAGAIEVTALNYRHELGFSSGYGFDAIAIALLGKNHPLGVVLASLLFAAMRNGATKMQFLTQIPVDIISIIQALILLFVSADAIVRYIYRIRTPQERVVYTRGWGK